MPEYDLFKKYPNPVFDYIWVDDTDYEYIKTCPITIAYGGPFTLFANVRWYFLLCEQTGAKMKIIWQDQMIEEGVLTLDGMNIRNDYRDLNYGLAILDDGRIILFIHPDFFRYKVGKCPISFTNDLQLPMLSEIIRIDGREIALSTTLCSNYVRKKFILVNTPRAIRGHSIIPGYYKISPKNLIIGFTEFNNETHLSIGKVFKVDTPEEETPFVYYVIKYSYSNGIWNTPFPPKKACDVLEALQKRASEIAEVNLNNFKGYVWEDQMPNNIEE
jgi:hypothetical protein